MSNKLEVMLSSRALPKLEKIEYGPVFAVWMMQLGDELRQMNQFQKIEALCAIEGITFVKTMRDKRETGQTGS
jgi:hypothetical protein